MANNKAEFDFIINVLGNLAHVIKEQTQLNAELIKAKKINREAAKSTDELAQANRRSAAAAAEHDYKQSQGVRGTASAGRSMSKLAQTIGSGPNGLVGAYATLAANAFAVSAAFNQLRSAAQVEQMMKGLETQGARTGKNLKGLSQDLQELTNYAISSADAMQATALMTSAGFSSKGMKDLTAVANNAALALGRSVPDALDRISKGVTKLEPELLDELGIMTKLTEAQSMYALQNNKTVASLSSFEKRQAMLNAVVAEGTVKFGGLSDEVGANPYDQLGATFSNLTKNTLNFVNSLLGPVASIFGSNQGMLLGGVILFVSTIRKQLMPALFEMSENAIKARDAHLEEAKAIRDKTTATLNQAKADRQAAIAAAQSRAGSIAGAALPKKFKSKEIQEGTLSLKELNAEYNRLESSIRARKASIEGTGFKVDPNKIPQKQAELKLIEQERDNLAKLIELQTKSEDTLKPLRAKARKSRLDFIKEEALASMEGKKAAAIEAANAGELKTAWQEASAAAREYKKSIAAQSKSGRVQEDGSIGKQSIIGKAADWAKGQLGSAGIFAQTAVAGVMKFLPYVGMAITALSGAWSVYQNFIKSDAAKAHEEALNKLKQTLDNTAKSVQELNRLNSASIPIGLKAAQALTIQSNATAEIAAGFKEVQDAAANMKNTNETDSFWKAIIGSPEDAVSYATGIAKDSDMFKPVAEELTNSTASFIGTGLGAAVGGSLGTFLGPVGTVAGAALGAAIGNKVGIVLSESLPEEFNGIDEEAIAAYKAIDQLTKILDKDLADSMVKAAGGANNLAKSPALRNEFIRQAAAAYRGVADTIKELQEAFKQTGDSITQFFTSAIPSTPFDGLVKGYTAVNKAFRDLDKTLGGSKTSEQIKLLASMPDEMVRMLDLPAQQLLDTLKKQSQQYTENSNIISELQKKGKDITNEESKILQSLIAENNALKTSMESYGDKSIAIRKTLVDTENTVRANQRQSREYDSQLKLINAISSANAEVYSKTAAGEKARIERHNEEISLQQTQLKLQIDIAETYLVQTRNILAQLKAQQLLLNVTKEQDIATLQAAQRQAEVARNEMRTAAIRAGLSEDYLNSIDSIISKQKVENKLLTGNIAYNKTGDLLKAAEAYGAAQRSFEVASLRSSNAISINDYTNQIADYEQNIESLRRSVQALDLSTIGAQEKAGRIKAKSVELSNQEEARARELRDINEEITDSARTTLLLERKRLNSIYETIRAKAIEAERGKAAMAAESGARIATLQAERDIYAGRLKDHADMAQIDKDAYTAYIASLDRQIEAEKSLNEARQKRLAITTQQQILESIIGGGLEDSLAKLQDSIDLRQKQLDLASQLADKQLQIAQNESKIALARVGATANEKTQKAFEVEAAERAYRTALEQNDLKMRAIDAEYELLKAKRDMDVETLKTQLYLLKVYDQIFNNGKNSEEIKKLSDTVTETVGRFQAVNIDVMKQQAQLSQAADVRLAKQRVDLARTEYSAMDRPKSGVVGIAANWQAQILAMRRADEIAGQKLTPEQKTFSVDLSDQAKANTTIVGKLVDISADLSKIREVVIPTLPEISSNTSATGSTFSTDLAGRKASANIAAERATASGLTVGEFVDKRGRSSLTMQHQDPGHAAGTAFDLSGGTEAQIQAQVEKAVLEGAKVIWKRKTWELGEDGKIRQTAFTPSKGAKGSDPWHDRHAHISYKRAIVEGAEQAAPEVTKATSTAVADGTRQGTLEASQDPKATAAQAAAAAARQEKISGVEQGALNSTATVEATQNVGTAAEESGKKVQEQLSNVQLFIQQLPRAMEVAQALIEELGAAMSDRLGQDFGPQGKIITSLGSFVTTFSVTIPQTLGTLKQSYSDWAKEHKDLVKKVGEDTAHTIQQAEQIGAAFQAAAQIIASIAGLLKSISDAKIAAVDKEIAAEQKRDGKSAESVSKLESLEKKKDSMARKAFNTQKKLMLAQAVMSTAAAVAGTYASLAPIPVVGPTLAAVAAGVIGALGLAQVAIISGMQYESSYSPKAAATPSTLSIGKRDSSVDLAKGPNANAGGEVSYLRGAEGTGTNASNYRTVGSAYGGDMTRGYGNRGFVVGEKGPELITPETPITVTPANDIQGGNPINANISIHAIDSQGVQDVLVSQKGNIIKMLREAANASGQRFMENVNVNVYTRPNVGKL